MNEQDFSTLAAQGYNRIPLMREVLADLDTPLSTYLKLADGPYSYLFESVQGGEKWGRYSIIGLPSRTVIRVYGNEIIVTEEGQQTHRQEVEDPLAWIENYQAQFRVAEVENLPRFNGGLVGYFGYDTIRYIEPKLRDCPNPDTLNTPDILLMVSDEIVVFDNLAGKLYVIVHADPRQSSALAAAEQRLLQLVHQLRSSVPAYPVSKQHRQVNEDDFVSGFTREGFEQAVDKAKEYIVEVFDSNGETIWGGFNDTEVQHTQIGQNATSAVFNFDGSATDELQDGEVYRWKIYADSDDLQNIQGLISSSEDQMGLFKYVDNSL